MHKMQAKSLNIILFLETINKSQSNFICLLLL